MLDWTFPYPSQRMPVFARNVVATSQPLAAQAGLRMLQAGGNAIDAAIATAAVLTVTEPSANGLGSDAFALVWTKGRLHGLNASGRAPKGLSMDRFAGLTTMPRRGWDAVTVPGAVSAWVALAQAHGTMPMRELLAPAIAYARDGYPVAPQNAAGWKRAVASYTDFAEFQRVFAPQGRAPRVGEIVKLPDHARTLQAIAESDGRAFYEGEIAQAIDAAARTDGAPMRLDDLAAHRADWVEPISVEYRGHRVHEIPPNGQGIAALMALGMLRGHDIGSLQVDCPDVLHLQLEAMKLAFVDLHRNVGDPATMTVTTEQLIADEYLARRARSIDPSRAGDPGHGDPTRAGTVLLCTADAAGNMVSFIQSNYEGFGSGIVVPGWGITLQNRGACFSVEPGHPNCIGPGKRPFHTIIPGFVTRDGEPVMAFGVMGGAMQTQGHLQVLSRLIDFGQNPQTAIDAPRWQIEAGRTVKIEPGFPDDVYAELRRRGHELTVVERRTVAFGGAQAILRHEGAWCAASDPRRDGEAVGW